MREINTSYQNFGAGMLVIGKAGENLVTKVVIDVSAPMATYPYAAFALRVQNAEGVAYPASHSYMEDDKLIWVITDADTAVPGDGWAQIVMYGAEDEIAKSSKAKVKVQEGIPDGGIPPDPLEDWMAEAQKTLEDLKDAGTVFETDETLTLHNGVLSVNTANELEPDNTLPITSSAVHINVAQIMNILNGLIARIEALENGTVIQPDETSAVLGTAILDKMVLA